jgi:hypothetical protein
VALRVGYREALLCGCEVRVLAWGINVATCRPHAQALEMRDVLGRAYAHIPEGFSVLRADIERVLADAGSPLPVSAGAGLVAGGGDLAQRARS